MTTATMTFFAVDTLQFSKRLQKAGLNQQVAEELAEAIKDTQNHAIEGLANKHDLKILEHRFDVLDQKFDVLEQRFDVLNRKFDAFEGQIVVKMFLMTIAAVSIVTWLDKVIG